MLNRKYHITSDNPDKPDKQDDLDNFQPFLLRYDA